MRPARARSVALTTAAALSLLLAGCVSLPTSGSVHVVTPPPESGGLSQPNVITMDPIPPGPNFTPKEIVSGFLAASGASKAVAKEYLTPLFAGEWQPSPRPHVIDSVPNVTQLPVLSHVTGGQATDQVTVTSQHLETLASAGEDEPGTLTVSQGRSPYTFKFELTKLRHSGWRIDGIHDEFGKSKDTLLLLTESDFQRDYLPLDLYFPATTVSALVPSPVYISATHGELGVRQLVNGLTSVQPWLYRAVRTAFPGHAPVSVQVHGSEAVVDFGGKIGNFPQTRLDELEAELVWTLTNSPYAGVSTGIRSVLLQMKHSSAFLVQSDFLHSAPPSVTGPLYYQTLSQAGQPQLNMAKIVSTGPRGVTVESRSRLALLPPSFGRGPFSAIAVSPPSSSFPPTFAGCRGKEVYFATLIGDSQPLPPLTLQSPCTSLSWDNQRDLWITAGREVFVVNETLTGPRSIPATIAPEPISSSDVYGSISVSPDGARVAMIVKNATGTGVYVTAISKVAESKTEKTSRLVYLGQGNQVLTVGPDLVDPVALSWRDADHLLVLDRRHGDSQLYDVPLDGGQSAPVPTPPDAVSVTANGSVVAVGTEHQGHVSLKISRNLDGIWRQLTVGSTPVYPG